MSTMQAIGKNESWALAFLKSPPFLFTIRVKLDNCRISESRVWVFGVKANTLWRVP